MGIGVRANSEIMFRQSRVCLHREGVSLYMRTLKLGLSDPMCVYTEKRYCCMCEQYNNVQAIPCMFTHRRGIVARENSKIRFRRSRTV